MYHQNTLEKQRHVINVIVRAFITNTIQKIFQSSNTFLGFFFFFFIVAHVILGLDLYLQTVQKGRVFSRCYSIARLIQKIRHCVLNVRRRESLKGRYPNIYFSTLIILLSIFFMYIDLLIKFFLRFLTKGNLLP